MGTEEVGRLAAVTLPGTGAGRSRARWLTLRPGTEGEEPREEGEGEEEEEEESIRHRRTTAHPGLPRSHWPHACFLVPPNRQHDRRAAPGLLLHRVEG